MYLAGSFTGSIHVQNVLDDDAGDMVLGAQQSFDHETQELTFVTYSLEDSLQRARDVDHPVQAHT